MSEGARFVLPTDDGDADQLLKTDGNGNLGWRTLTLNNPTSDYLQSAFRSSTWQIGNGYYPFAKAILPYVGIQHVNITNGVWTCPWKGIWLITAECHLRAEGTPMAWLATANPDQKCSQYAFGSNNNPCVRLMEINIIEQDDKRAVYATGSGSAQGSVELWGLIDSPYADTFTCVCLQKL